MSNSLWPSMNTRLPCPSPSPGVCSNSCPLSWWCHPTISPSVTPFSSCPQSFPASGSFPMSWLFTSCDQSTGASALALAMSVQGWFPLGLTGWISFLSKWLSRVFSSTTVQKHQFFGAQPSLWSNSHIHSWLLEKLHWPLLAKWYLEASIPSKRQMGHHCRAVLKVMHTCELELRWKEPQNSKPQNFYKVSVIKSLEMVSS